MDKVSLYIQKLIVLILVAAAGIILSSSVNSYILVPSLFFALALLSSRISGKKPEYLYGYLKSDEFLNKKAGFWVLFKWILVLFGFIYDLVIWTLYGGYILITIVLDSILLIKDIIYWIIHSIIWFLRLFVHPIVLLFKLIIHYIFLWTWWVYKLCFDSIRKSINLNFYFISLQGGVLMLFLIFLFYGMGILMAIPQIFVVGAVFSVLPLVWSYGEISSLRLRKSESENYQKNRKNFQSGFDAVRAVLSYFIIFLILVLVELFFNLLGWIPQIGFSFMGLALNINTLASLLLIFVFVMLLFAKLILPPHVVYNKNYSVGLNGSITFLDVVGRRFLRYFLSGLPSMVFGVFVTVIPAIIVILSIVITLNIKNSILDTRISFLNQRMTVLEGIEKYKTRKELDRAIFYKAFPQNLVSEFSGLKSLNASKENSNANILQGEKEIENISLEFSEGIDSLNKRIDAIMSRPMADSASSIELVRLEALKKSRIAAFSKWKEEGADNISKMKIDYSEKRSLMIQLPLVFLLTVVWASFFGGIVLAFLISYLGNVYFELYNFREDGKPIYLRQLLNEIHATDRNQPLLGFTLIVLIGLAIFFYRDLFEVVNRIGTFFSL